MGHKIWFYGEIWLIIPKLSSLPLLICSTVRRRRKVLNIGGGGDKVQNIWEGGGGGGARGANLSLAVN